VSGEQKYTAEELVRILKACKSAGVTELKIGDISVQFCRVEDRQTKRVESEIHPPTEAELKEAASDTLVRENLESAEDRLDLLQIENPALYERMLIEGELGDRRASAETQN
jgi:hypothetical protein